MDDLLQAIENYIDARKTYRTCVENCEYDAGYFCSKDRDKMTESLNKVEIEFKKCVRDAVNDLKSEL